MRCSGCIRSPGSRWTWAIARRCHLSLDRPSWHDANHLPLWLSEIRVVRVDGAFRVRYLVAVGRATLPHLSPRYWLTQRQREVVDFAALGLTNREIADSLEISVLHRSRAPRPCVRDPRDFVTARTVLTRSCELSALTAISAIMRHRSQSAARRCCPPDGGYYGQRSRANVEKQKTGYAPQHRRRSVRV